MTWVARTALRLASRAGLRWIVVAASARFVLRRLRRGAVERAAAELEARAHEKLPAPAARAVSALPPGIRHAGGSAVVATRTARRAVSSGRRATRATRDHRNQVTSRVAAARDTLHRIRHETDASSRRLRSRYLGAAVGADAATDALLDFRDPGLEHTGGRGSAARDPIGGPAPSEPAVPAALPAAFGTVRRALRWALR